MMSLNIYAFGHITYIHHVRSCLDTFTEIDIKANVNFLLYFSFGVSVKLQIVLPFEVIQAYLTIETLVLDDSGVFSPILKFQLI